MVPPRATVCRTAILSSVNLMDCKMSASRRMVPLCDQLEVRVNDTCCPVYLQQETGVPTKLRLVLFQPTYLHFTSKGAPLTSPTYL